MNDRQSSDVSDEEYYTPAFFPAKLKSKVDLVAKED